MTKHGFARDMDFELLSQSEKVLWFVLKSSEETLKTYPYEVAFAAPPLFFTQHEWEFSGGNNPRRLPLTFYPAWVGVFLRGGGNGIACSGFSVLRFRRRFLSRMQTPRGKWAGMPISVRGGKDAA